MPMGNINKVPVCEDNKSVFNLTKNEKTVSPKN